jgi:alpha-galactosidase
MCISGDVVELSEDRFQRLVEAQAFYRKVSPIIASGVSRLQSHTGSSRRRPEGWQAMVRVSTSGDAALVVVHSFENPGGSCAPVIRLPEDRRWVIAEAFNLPDGARLDGDRLSVEGMPSFSAFAVKLAAG